MSDHGNGQQGPAAATGQPPAGASQQGVAAGGFAPGASASRPAPTQGASEPPPNGPHTGMAGTGMPGGYPGPGAYLGQPGYGATSSYPGMPQGTYPGIHPGQAPHPAGYGLPPGFDPYWAAYHVQAQAQAGYASPPPYAGMTPLGMPHPGYPPAFGAMPAQPPISGGGHGPRSPGISELADEIANGGNGLSSLSKMLNLEDSEFWKGALLGAAAVLLLTNESVQGALFKTGAKAKSVVKTGVDRVKEGPQRPRPTAPAEPSDV